MLVSGQYPTLRPYLGTAGTASKEDKKTRIALRGKAIHHLHPSTILVLQFDTVALCSACGTELGADARFCRNCGRPAADTAFARATSEPLGDAEIEKTLPTILQYSRRTRTPWYLAISGFVGIICEFIDITLNTRQSAVPGFAALVVFAVWTPKGFDWVYQHFISPKRKLPDYQAIIAGPHGKR